ncbi:hypothetical protein GQ53DRAFT_750635 [Thozetella sp. PMI_491]|nr:hypothetical protein GQ53DRAFT_750635 [Thozetella sp. PMI_491]
MARGDESKEGLLNGSEQYGKSWEEDTAYHFRQESDDESDLDATDFLDRDPLTSNTPRPAFLNGQKPRWSIKRPFTGCSRCCIILLAIVGSFWLLLAAGGAFVYKKFLDEPPYGQSPPWYPTPPGGTVENWRVAYEKAANMVSKMTLAEKVNVTTGTGWQMGLAVGTNGPAIHVGFPQLQLQDGPLGIRFADNSTAFPAGITVGATWNKTLMYERGKAHGAEARGKGINVLLGPCVGPLGRMPAGGRNWEGFGADPYLQGIAGAETIKGIQSEGVMATVKHFVANEQEHFRQPFEWALPHALSANIDDRTLHELYAWPFADAVRAGVASVMCSYNMVNNSYACGNSKLLNGILKDELGFQGFVMSDWLAQHAGVSTALAGLDMTMPGDGGTWANGESYWGPHLSRAVLNGSVPVERLNDMVTRIVAAWYQLGQDDETKFPRKPPNFSSWTNERTGVMAPGSKSPQDKVEVNQFVNVQADHATIARQVAAEGTILLKNVNVLPISRQGFTDAKLKMRRDLLERETGKRHTGKLKVAVFGEDAGPGKGPNFCEDRACNQGTLASGWGSGAVDFPYLVPPIEPLRNQLNMSKVEFFEFLTNDPPAKKDEAILDELELCFVFVNADSGEGNHAADGVSGDRPNINLAKGGDDFIIKVAAKCGKGFGEVVVVVHTVGPVLMEKWVELPNVKAVLLANLPGQESGNALADVIFGDVNPSGHLPYTIGKSLGDYGPGAKVMYIPNGVIPQQNFDEGLYIDYRHFDKNEIMPRYEFGFGMSYTDFEIVNAQVSPVKSKSPLPPKRGAPAVLPPNYPNEIPDEHEVLFPDDFHPLDKYIYPYLETIDDIVGDHYKYPDGYFSMQPASPAGGGEGGHPDLWETYVTVQVEVKNIGARSGAVVPQLYMAYPQGGSQVDFPVKVLRGFEKVFLEKGETTTVGFNITRRDLSYWDVEKQNWVMVTTGGPYTFMIGKSSRDLTAFGQW